MRLLRTTRFVLVLAIGACTSACGGDDSSSGKAGSSTAPEVAPLTGRRVAEALERPALSVKVDNNPRGRPQIGLDTADIVFEELTEGGITRFLAVFHSHLPDAVGPIRSVRAVDPALVTPLGGVVAYSGGTPPNVEALERAPVTAVNETAAGEAMHRDPSREAPHNLYGTPKLLLAHAGPQAAAPAPWFKYGAPSASAGAVACTHVSIVFSREFASTYDWAAGKGWLRSTPAGPFLMASGQQIAPTNVIVLSVTDQTAEATTGSGDALVFTGGKLIRGTWERSDVAEPFRLLDQSGAPVRLGRGTTWLHLAVDNSTTIETCPPA